MSCLTVILKMSERCNLNCSYCYFFNSKDQSYKERPAFLSDENKACLLEFLLEGVKQLGISKVVIGLHGGEPLLYGKERFIKLCNDFIDKWPKEVQLGFSLQTNGLLLDEEWVGILEKYKVDIGISIDGPKDFHDIYRVDHFGNGSYDRLIKKIHLLHKMNARFGVLSVINPKIGGKNLYTFLTNELKVKSFDLLFPHLTHDELSPYSMDEFAKFLCDIFDAWTLNNNKKIKIRIFISFLRQLLGGSRLLYGIGAIKNPGLPLITIRSDGKLEPVTGLMYTDPNTVTNTTKNINNTSLKDFLTLPIFQELKEAQTIMPENCSKCCWEKICGGGHIIDRFSIKNRFNNPSTYCSVMMDIYAHMTKYLLDSGIPESRIRHSLAL